MKWWAGVSSVGASQSQTIAGTSPTWLLHSAAPAPQTMTVAVYGLGRSGTTMVARVLVSLGIDMGADLTPRACEDRILRGVLKRGDMAAFTAYRDRRNAEASVWGFKVPAFRHVARMQVPGLRNPRLVITLRDPLAIALRNNAALELPVPDLLHQSAAKTLQLLADARELSCPILLVSYEKALRQPVALVQALAEFCGCGHSPAQIEAVAASSVLHGDPRYFAP